MANNYEVYEQIKELDNNAATNMSRDRIRSALRNYYYNVFMSAYEITGLDEELAAEQEDYIKRKLWADGTVAARDVKTLGILVFCTYGVSKQTLYDTPAEVTLVNEREVSRRLIPTGPQTVNKDVVLIYGQHNRKGIKDYVYFLVDKIVDAEMTLRTNLIVQKIPFIFPVDDDNEAQVKQFMKKVLNDEVSIGLPSGNKGVVTVLQTGAPYIIDKLKAYIITLHGEILNYLGIDSSAVNSTGVNITADEVNSNNQLINTNSKNIVKTVQSGFDKVNSLFGRDIKITAVNEPVDSIHDIDYNRNLEVEEEGDGNV